MHTIKTVTLDRKENAICEPGVTHEYYHWFGSLVKTHLSMFMWPNQKVHRLARAFSPNSVIPFAFCYYYVNQDTGHCEIFGIYVDEPNRHQRIAEDLIICAVSECVRNNCTSFAFRFLSPNARSGRLVHSIRQMFVTQYPHTSAQLYFPNEPYFEQIGE